MCVENKALLEGTLIALHCLQQLFIAPSLSCGIRACQTASNVKLVGAWTNPIETYWILVKLGIISPGRFGKENPKTFELPPASKLALGFVGQENGTNSIHFMMSHKFCTISYSWVPKTHPNPNSPPFEAKHSKKELKQKKVALRNVSEQTNNKELNKKKLHIQTFQMKFPSWWFQPIPKILVKFNHFPK